MRFSGLNVGRANYLIYLNIPDPDSKIVYRSGEKTVTKYYLFLIYVCTVPRSHKTRPHAVSFAACHKIVLKDTVYRYFVHAPN